MNRYYEKNITTGDVTTYYYLGGRLVALRKGTTLEYVHQDHPSAGSGQALGGSFVSTDGAGAQKASVAAPA
ncbi:MAG: hypothetical protein HY330_07745 [Chloroflexi bacterium]|nr:hypothetical protein [Chloroflexota bacterium]